MKTCMERLTVFITDRTVDVQLCFYISIAQYEDSQEKPQEMAKTKEQLEEEKQAALSQRIVPLDLSGMDTEALKAKAKELHDILYKLESEKYDLDDRYKRQQYDVSVPYVLRM